jgi:HSP20 family protein
MGPLFDELTDRLAGERWRPAVDVYETEKAVVVQVELSGVRREDLRVSVHGEKVRIRGVRQVARGAEIQRLHQVEITSGPFERLLRIVIPFERDQVSANLEDGFLRVVLPKQLPSKMKIEVEGRVETET